MATLLSMFVPASASPYAPYLEVVETDLEALINSFC